MISLTLGVILSYRFVAINGGAIPPQLGNQEVSYRDQKLRELGEVPLRVEVALEEGDDLVR